MLLILQLSFHKLLSDTSDYIVQGGGERGSIFSVSWQVLKCSFDDEILRESLVLTNTKFFFSILGPWSTHYLNLYHVTSILFFVSTIL